MKIYTKKGDAGETGLFGGARVSKDHVRIDAYGNLDELNAVLGLAIAEKRLPQSLEGSLQRVQSELFQLGAELATPGGKSTGIRLVGSEQIHALEREIDEMEKKLQPLRAFILPGGSVASAWLHLARTVSRRAERGIVSLHQEEELRPEVLQYINRLSDYLFVCARLANHEAGHPDVPWEAPRS